MRFIYRILQFILGAFFALLTVGVLGVFALYAYYSPQLPDAAELRRIDIQVPLRIYTRDGELMAEYGERRSRPVTLDEVPVHLKHAFLDIEDARFYEHKGVDFKGVLRALSNVASTGSASQGASTITMQLARNAFLDSGKNIERKLKETLLAVKLEETLTKDQILELYLNKIYLGNRAYGIASAAETYYGKKLNELTLAQMAMIAGLPKAPSRYNPLANSERAMIRRDYILKRMLELGHITQSEYDTAVQEPNTAKQHKTEIDIDAPYLAEMVRAEVVRRFGEANAYTQGYHVYTTLDTKRQEAAAEALRHAVLTYDRRHGYRGAEDKVDLKELPTEDDRRDKLSSYPILGDLHPALVLKTSSNSAELLLGENVITLGFEAVQWAREFKSADRRGPAPRRVSDVLSPGDIVRLRPTNKEKTAWTLSQVPAVGAALVSIDPHDGAVRAVMGGFDFEHSKFNRATQALRQPGSSFKPIVYAAALSQGFTPTSIVNDAPITIPGSNWKPENFGGRYIGPTTLREALAKSRNLVSIRLLRSVGIEYTIDFATKFGFPRENLPRNLTLALGTNMTTPLEMATAYAAFANGGFRIDPYFITKIEDRNRNVLFEVKPVRVCGDDGWQCKDANGNVDPALNVKVVESDKPVWETEMVMGNPLAAKRIMTARTNYQIVDMLQGVTQFGTAARASKVLNRTDIAGKTGTTNDYKDAWFCGFTPDVVSVAWIGFDDMAKLGEGETATNLALPMWIDFMHRILEGVPAKEWDRPADLKQASTRSRREVAYDSDERPAPRRRTNYQRQPVDNAAQPAAQAPRPQAPRPPRAPERLEIPEQLF